jgi:hypothetical protein
VVRVELLLVRKTKKLVLDIVIDVEWLCWVKVLIVIISSSRMFHGIFEHHNLLSKINLALDDVGV